VPTIDVCHMTAGLPRGGDGCTGLEARHVGLVLDFGAPAGQAQRLVADLGVLVLRLKAKAAPARRSALGVFAGTTMLGVALHDVIAVPVDARDGQLAFGERGPRVPRDRHRPPRDRPPAGRPRQPRHGHDEPQLPCVGPVRLAPHRGLWTLHVDGVPSLRPWNAPVEVRCLVDNIEQVTA
jgi:hypothetical protein